jgi:C_GCAxxG_C_C family probable redox protein
MPNASEIDDALRSFADGFNCAQAVFAAFAERNGLSRELALRVACPFGIGMMRGTACGAVTGGLMALGLMHGRTRVGDLAARARTYALAETFQKRFEKVQGSTSCATLLGVDPSTPAGRVQALESGAFQSRCPGMVKTAVELVLELA